MYVERRQILTRYGGRNGARSTRLLRLPGKSRRGEGAGPGDGKVAIDGRDNDGPLTGTVTSGPLEREIPLKRTQDWGPGFQGAHLRL